MDLFNAKIQNIFEISSQNVRFGLKKRQKLGKTRKNSESRLLLLYFCTVERIQRQKDVLLDRRTKVQKSLRQSEQLTTIY